MPYEGVFIFTFIAIGAAISGLGFLAYYRTGATHKGRPRGTGSGTSRPKPLHPVFLAGMSALIVGAAIAPPLLRDADSGAMAAIVPLMNVIVFTVSMPVLIRQLVVFLGSYNLAWDEHGITGPGQLGPPPFGPRRTHMAWSDIASRELHFAYVSTKVFLVLISHSGQTIRWSSDYSRDWQLRSDVSTYRPDLPTRVGWPRPRAEARAEIATPR